MADCLDVNDVKEIVREVMNSKVVYRDTCEMRHQGDTKMIEELKGKLKTLDGRLWALLVLALVQVVGIAVVLAKGG